MEDGGTATIQVISSQMGWKCAIFRTTEAFQIHAGGEYSEWPCAACPESKRAEAFHLFAGPHRARMQSP